MTMQYLMEITMLFYAQFDEARNGKEYSWITYHWGAVDCSNDSAS